jgi:hypothetical protein
VAGAIVRAFLVGNLGLVQDVARYIMYFLTATP